MAVNWDVLRTCQLSVAFLAFGSCFCSGAQFFSSLLGEESPVRAGRVVRRQICCYEEVLGIEWKLNVPTQGDSCKT